MSGEKTYWVYIRSGPGLFTVGFYCPDGNWHTDSDHDSKEEARQRAHYFKILSISILPC